MLRFLFKKSRLPLIIPLILTCCFFFIGVTFVSAQGASRAQDIGLDVLSNACSGGFLNPIPKEFGTCISYVFAKFLYIIVGLVSWLLWAVGQIFNMVIGVQNGAFHDQAMVNVGWKIARDITNIFYIFFLLIISIGIILRQESYGSKQLLWKLIVSALLVNFSLPIAGILIDFSNALGNTFYTNIAPETTIPLTDIKTRDISTAFVSGFQPQKLFGKDQTIKKQSGAELADTLLNILIAEIFAIVMIVVISIVLFSAITLLLIRIVVLWFVLILAPFAFLFWVLPRTSILSGEWFETLFKHAFFYPAFMFTLYIVITAINHGTIATLVGADAKSIADGVEVGRFAAQGESYFTQKIQLILNFVVLTMFAGGGLLVAQKMSVQGAGAAIKLSNSLGKSARGYAGRIANIPAAALSDQVLKRSAGITNARVFGVPVGRAVGQALRPAALSLQKRESDRAKAADAQAARVKNLAPAASASMLGSMNARGRAKAFDTMDDKQKARVIQQMNTHQQVAFAKTIHTTDPNKDYNRQVAIASGSVERAMEILHGLERPKPGASETEKKDYQEKVDKYVKGLNEKDMAKLRGDTINDVYFQRAAIKNGVDTEKLQNSADFIDPEARKAFEELTRNINNVTGSIKILTGMEAPQALPPKPQEPEKPVPPKPEDGMNLEKQKAYFDAQAKYVDDKKKYDTDIAQYNKDHGDEIKYYDKYREEMSEYIAKYVPEKKLEKVAKETIKGNPSFQDVMIEEMTGTDIRRMAKDREGAAAIREGFKSYAERKYKLDIDKDGDWDKIAQKIGSEDGAKNKALSNWMQQNMGAKAIIQQGRAASRRDLPSPVTSPSGNSNEINPTPPAPPPTTPVSGGSI